MISAADYPSLQDALDVGGNVYLPAGIYSEPAVIHKRIVLHGDGVNDTVFVQPIEIRPKDGMFYVLRDFGCYGGISVILQKGKFFANFDICGLWLGSESVEHGLLLDNCVGNSDGFFTGKIRNCRIANGILGTHVGDSIIISGNTITGRGLGISLSGVSGARQIVIRENNISSMGGSIALFGCEQTKIRDNQLEHPSYLGGYQGPHDAQVYLANCSFCEIDGNTITPALPGLPRPNYSVLAEGRGGYLRVQNNHIAKGALDHIVVDGLAANTGTVITPNILVK